MSSCFCFPEAACIGLCGGGLGIVVARIAGFGGIICRVPPCPTSCLSPILYFWFSPLLLLSLMGLFGRDLSIKARCFRPERRRDFRPQKRSANGTCAMSTYRPICKKRCPTTQSPKEARSYGPFCSALPKDRSGQLAGRTIWVPGDPTVEGPEAARAAKLNRPTRHREGCIRRPEASRANQAGSFTTGDGALGGAVGPARDAAICVDPCTAVCIGASSARPVVAGIAGRKPRVVGERQCW